MQKPLFETLSTEKVIYTQAHGGKWLNAGEAIFDRLAKNEPKELLLKVLLEADQNVATLPTHVLKAVSVYTTATKEITSSLVRSVLRENPFCYSSLERIQKLYLLQFVINCDDNNFVELLGLELLPVASGDFVPFSNSGETIYISSPDHRQELLPGLQHRFLDQNIDENLLRGLEAVAKEGTKVGIDLRHTCIDILVGNCHKCISSLSLPSTILTPCPKTGSYCDCKRLFFLFFRSQVEKVCPKSDVRASQS